MIAAMCGGNEAARCWAAWTSRISCDTCILAKENVCYKSNHQPKASRVGALHIIDHLVQTFEAASVTCNILLGTLQATLLNMAKLLYVNLGSFQHTKCISEVDHIHLEPSLSISHQSPHTFQTLHL